ILDVMQTVAAHGGLVMAHAEDDELVKYMEAKLAREGRDQWYNLHLVHSNLSERIAFHSIISLAREAGVPLYLAHVTGAEGVAAPGRGGRGRGGMCGSAGGGPARVWGGAAQLPVLHRR